MDSEDQEYPEISSEAEDEYCTVCHTVYAAMKGCWCAPGVSRGNDLDRTRS